MDDRQRKIEAGKEKLVQFLKKKNTQESGDQKKKKQKRSNRQDVSETSTSLNATRGSPDDNNMAEDCTQDARTEPNAPQDNSRHFVADLTQYPLSDTVSQIQFENEESLYSEDRFVKITVTELKQQLDGYSKKLAEYKHALQHRDKIIHQLSESLQNTIDRRDQLEMESSNQSETFAAVIFELKQQLHDASEAIRNHKEKNNSVEVKNQLQFLKESHQQEMNDQMVSWNAIKSELEQEIKKFQTEIEVHVKKEKDLATAKNKLSEELKQLRQLFTQKTMQKETEVQSLQSELKEVKQTLNEIIEKNKLVEEAFKSQILQKQDQHQGQLTEMAERLNRCLQERETLVIQLESNKQATVKQLVQLQSQLDEAIRQKESVEKDKNDLNIKLADILKEKKELIESKVCFSDVPISSNLDQVMKEILELKKENERLKESFKSRETDERLINQPMESGDHCGKTESEAYSWKNNYDKLLEEKNCLEARLSALQSESHSKFEAMTEQLNALKVHLTEESVYRSKYEALEIETNKKIETYINQINLLDKIKLQLNLQVCELESKCQSLVKSKEEIEKEYLQSKQNLAVNFDSYLLEAMKLEIPNISSVELLLKQMTAAENNLLVSKFQLCEAEETKCALNAKLDYLVSCCEDYELGKTQLKSEIIELHVQLQMLYEEHTKSIEELKELQNRLLEKEAMQKIFDPDKDSDMEVHDDKMSVKETVDSSRSVLDTYTREISELKENLQKQQLHNQQLTHQLRTSGAKVDNQICDGEWLDLKQKLQLVMDSNKELLEEKRMLTEQLKEQKLLIEKIQQEMSDDIHIGDALTEELVSLNQQQSEYLQAVQMQNQNQSRYFDVLEERNFLQATLKLEKDELIKNIKEKDSLEAKLINQKVELEHLLCEKRCLEEQLLHKDQIQQELKRQRRILEENLAELEHHLKDREDAICKEKIHLQMEIKKKDLVLRKWQVDFKDKQFEVDRLKSSLEINQSKVHAEFQLHQKSLHRIQQIRQEMDKHHSIAMERLKQELVDQFALREARLVESHLDEKSHLQRQHLQQIQLLQSNIVKDVTVSSCPESHLMNYLQYISDGVRGQLEQNLIDTEETYLENLQQFIKKSSRQELSLLYKEFNVELLKRQQQLESLHENKLKELQLNEERKRYVEIIELKENLSKKHKDEINKILADVKTQLDESKRESELHLALLLGEETITAKQLLKHVINCAMKEYQELIQNLTRQWESEYLERLANLRKEVEEKFKEVTTPSSFTRDKNQEDDSAKQHSSFTQFESMLDEKEQLLNKVTELRESIEKAHLTEVKVLKERLQTEFNSVIEIQTEMKSTLESNQSPVLVELKKIKEDYEKLQEKYEEITRLQ